MNKKGFTLIELLAVLVVLAILALISIPITIRIINNSRDNANKRSVDGYGKAIELAIALYQVNHNEKPNDIDNLDVNYTGNVDCDTKKIISNSRVFLTKCKIKDTYVMDKKTNDGYYHYGELNTAVDSLISKGNTNTSLTYDNGNKHELYAFSEPKTLQTEAGIDYRFIGNVPNNYIYFNDELWRIYLIQLRS